MRHIIIAAVIALALAQACSASFLSDGQARVRAVCAKASRDACMQRIRQEEMCVEYRTYALMIYNFKIHGISTDRALESIARNQAPAFPNEPTMSGMVSDAELEELAQAANLGRWATPDDFAKEAYQRCIR